MATFKLIKINYLLYIEQSLCIEWYNTRVLARPYIRTSMKVPEVPLVLSVCGPLPIAWNGVVYCFGDN